jgi:hypothetical protein
MNKNKERYGRELVCKYSIERRVIDLIRKKNIDTTPRTRIDNAHNQVS